MKVSDLITLLQTMPQDAEVILQKDAENPKAPYGMKTETIAGMEMQAAYYIPGLTLHDLIVIAEAARNSPEANRYTGNASKWPSVLAIKAIVEATKKAYNIE
jgi:hypothetical protein